MPQSIPSSESRSNLPLRQCGAMVASGAGAFPYLRVKPVTDVFSQSRVKPATSCASHVLAPSPWSHGRGRAGGFYGKELARKRQLCADLREGRGVSD